MKRALDAARQIGSTSPKASAIRATSSSPARTKEPALSERDFQKQVTDLAQLFGWEWMHIRSARTMDSWRTPVSGTLGAGFPDLVLARGSRIIFAELKRDGGKPTADQRRVLEVLGKAAEAYVWTPKDWDFLSEELR